MSLFEQLLSDSGESNRNNRNNDSDIDIGTSPRLRPSSRPASSPLFSYSNELPYTQNSSNSNSHRNPNLNSTSNSSVIPSDAISNPPQPSTFEPVEIPPSRRIDPTAIPKVIDKTGEKVRESFEYFLETFINPLNLQYQNNNNNNSTPFYINQINKMLIEERKALFINYDDLLTVDGGILAQAITDQYYRFNPFLQSALRSVVRRLKSKLSQNTTNNPILNSTHLHSNNQNNSTFTSGMSTTSSYTNDSNSHYEISFYNFPNIERIRSLRTNQIGKLVAISGTVTRTSEIRPELYKASFTCQECRAIIDGVEQVFKYTEPSICPNITCMNRTNWSLNVSESQFIDWQRVRVQENSGEIPTGCMPRTLDVILRGDDIVDHAKPGNQCVFTGTLIVVPDVSQLGLPGVKPEAVRDRNAPRARDAGSLGAVTGLKQLGARDLTYRMAFLACMVSPVNSRGSSHIDKDTDPSDIFNDDGDKYFKTNNNNDDEEVAERDENGNPTVMINREQEEFLSHLSQDDVKELKEMVHSDHIYANLVDSIAPAVYGHEIIKKGILLQLMGGVHKLTPDGIHLRGDINVCIVGDPSTSKSQFLKYVSGFLPRAIYTSGKASSAAGLTASVVKDEETGEFTIEAGALMLADNGICCIDEFDKMDISDQVAIHEAMEQQTISIAKAGVQATLNARTSILAAANPVGGRYNRRLNLRANIRLSAPIMSRFDLFFVLLDECNERIDTELASHIVDLHMNTDNAIDSPFSTSQLRRYIQYARTFKPKLTREARKYLIERYKELRAGDSQSGLGRTSYRITVRQLESLIRLSEAIARANCVDEVVPAFVREAYNLLKESIIYVEKDDVEVEEEEENTAEAGKSTESNEDVNDNNSMNVDTEVDTATQSADVTKAPKKKTTITLERYTEIMNILIRRIAADEDSGGNGLTEKELTRWYLQNKEDEIETEQQYYEESSVVKKVIKRLTKDHILLAVSGEGFSGSGEGYKSDETLYTLHPNSTEELMQE